MLVIRREQMEVLELWLREQFEARMVVHLRGEFAAQTAAMTDESLHALVRTGIEKANGYGVDALDDLQRFMECMVTYGTDFDTAPMTPWAAEILQDESLTGTQKMNRIDAHAAALL